MIKIQDLTFGYSRKQKLFDGLNLEAEQGSIIGLLGKNGAGKSTLLRLMAGLLKPHQGNISIMDHTPFDRQPSFLEQVYLVAEEFETPSTSISAYVKAAGGMYPAFDFEKMDRIINEFELDNTQKLSKMSYGQKKKFLIAFALSTNCKFLILDEPTNGLDIPSKALFRKVMAGSLTDDQVVIISTHQVKDIENLIDRIVLINHGQIKFNESIAEVTDHFAFHTVTDINNGDYLYQEAAPGGYRILKHKNGMETPIDIELLFNAVTQGTKLEKHESNI